MGHGRCVVQGCNRKSSSRSDKDNEVKIFSIPSVRKHDEDITSRRRVLWLKRLNLSDKDVPNHGGVCDVHFISGKPSHFIDEFHPDWAPSQKIGSKNLVSKSALERYNRRKKFQIVKANKRVENLLKRNRSSMNVDLHLTAVTSSSGITLLDQKNQMPDKIVNENKLDILHKLPVKNSSQFCNGKVVKLGKTNNSKVTRSLINLNGQTPLLPVKRTECQKGGVGTKQKDAGSNRRPMVVLPVATLQQVLRDPCEEPSLFVSNSVNNDHDYCAKPSILKSQQHVYMDHNYCQHMYMDHDYCRSLDSNGPSSIPENISELSLALPQAETPMQNSLPLELTGNECRENAYAVATYQNGLPSTSNTKSMCDLILPDNEQCSTCNELACLKSELKEKSLVLEARRNDVNSLKQELEIAKEHITNLRAQLEENTRTLWSCLSMNGQSSS